LYPSNTAAANQPTADQSQQLSNAADELSQAQSLNHQTQIQQQPQKVSGDEGHQKINHDAPFLALTDNESDDSSDDSDDESDNIESEESEIDGESDLSGEDTIEIPSAAEDLEFDQLQNKTMADDEPVEVHKENEQPENEGHREANQPSQPQQSQQYYYESTNEALEKVFQCNLCLNASKTVSGIKNHITRTHKVTLAKKDVPKVLCRKCNKVIQKSANAGTCAVWGQGTLQLHQSR
jgi:hypothetical protein